MKFALAAGGTAGHINPALALAEELKLRGHELIMVGTATGLEARLVDQAGFRFVGVECSGFNRAAPLSIFTAFMSTQRASKQLEKLFCEEQLDAVIGFGAYVELPAVFAAKRLGIPYMLHEQNSLPGMANLFAAPHAALIALSYEAARGAFEKKCKHKRVDKIIFTGNPVRRKLREAELESSRQRLGLQEGEKLLVVFGGSLGAQHLNETLIQLAPSLLADPARIVIHAAGKADYERSSNQLQVLVDTGQLSQEAVARYKLMPYIDNMDEVLAAAELAITRAGASTLSELIATTTPALLVPYPFARGDHQRTNAEELVQIQAAQMIDDASLSESHDKILKFVESPDMLSEMKDRLGALRGSGAQIHLADHLEAIVERN